MTKASFLLRRAPPSSSAQTASTWAGCRTPRDWHPAASWSAAQTSSPVIEAQVETRSGCPLQSLRCHYTSVCASRSRRLALKSVIPEDTEGWWQRSLSLSTPPLCPHPFALVSNFAVVLLFLFWSPASVFVVSSSVFRSACTGAYQTYVTRL